MTTPAPSAEETLRSFVMWLFGEFDEASEISVADLQDEALKRGLMIEVEVTEPCGEFCACAELGEGFPMTCLKYGPALLSPHAGEERQAQ